MSYNFESLRLLPNEDWIVVKNELEKLCFEHRHSVRVCSFIKYGFVDDHFWINYTVCIFFYN